MLTLIRNELFKIFHKKSTYIVLAISLLFIILINSLIRYVDTASMDYMYHYDNSSDNAIVNKAKEDLNKRLSEYADGSWQYAYIGQNYFDIAFNYYSGVDEDTYNSVNKALKDNDWKSLVNNEIDEVKTQIKTIENDKSMQASLFALKEKLGTLEYRLKEDVAYGKDYINESIDFINDNAELLYEAEHPSNSEYSNDELIKVFNLHKYVLESKEDIFSTNNLREIIMYFFDQFLFLIFVFVIMISGGIVSDELNKGTIKQLLIAPYKRSTILLAKFFTTLIMIVFIILFLLVCELLVGGLLLGFDSLSISAVVYNLTTKSIEIMSPLKYFFIMCVSLLPQIILLSTLAFSLSTIIGNTAFAIAITFCGVIGASIINAIALAYKVKFLNYFVTANWNFNLDLFGNTNPYGNSIAHAVIVCLVYFLIMVIASLVYFKKKNIKNV